MIGYPRVSLPSVTAQGLAALQASVIGAGSFSDQVASGKALFKQHNSASNALFGVVRDELFLLCGRTRRCAYCEDSMADEVEHIAPKDFYPDLVFEWENYLYACGPCNSSNKKAQWSVLSYGATDAIDVTRAARAPAISPPGGLFFFINPRIEDPMYFLQLDLKGGTGFYGIRPDLSAIDQKRGEYTRRILGLNSRAGLPEGRMSAYVYLRSTLECYDREKAAGNLGNQSRIAEQERCIRDCSHRTVWKEMQRQRMQIAELGPLFSRNPETLTW